MLLPLMLSGHQVIGKMCMSVCMRMCVHVGGRECDIVSMALI